MIAVFGVLMGAVVLYLVVGIFIAIGLEGKEGAPTSMQELPLWPLLVLRAALHGIDRRSMWHDRKIGTLSEIESYFRDHEGLQISRASSGDATRPLIVRGERVTYTFRVLTVAGMIAHSASARPSALAAFFEPIRRMVNHDMLFSTDNAYVVATRSYDDPHEEQEEHDAGVNETTIVWNVIASDPTFETMLWTIAQDLVAIEEEGNDEEEEGEEEDDDDDAES